MLRTLLCFLLLTSSVYSQDWFSIAEEVFDVDYYEIERVRVLGDNQRGIVLCVWMSDVYGKAVLTKTLKKASRQTKQTKDNSNNYKPFNYGVDIHTEEDEEPETVDDLLYQIREIINRDEMNAGPLKFNEEYELESIYYGLARLRNINNFEDIFEAIKDGIEFAASKGVEILTRETMYLSEICQTDSFCIENYNKFINKLKNQYNRIEVN